MEFKFNEWDWSWYLYVGTFGLPTFLHRLEADQHTPPMQEENGFLNRKCLFLAGRRCSERFVTQWLAWRRREGSDKMDLIRCG